MDNPALVREISGILKLLRLYKVIGDRLINIEIFVNE